MDYYKVLQVDPAADPEVIEAAYHRLARKTHPDLNPSPDATTRMAAINEAYEVLREPHRRARYDASRITARPRRPEPIRRAPEQTGSLGQKVMAALIVLMIVGLIAAMGWAMGGGF